ncbi:MAG: dephospho-CoA kinase [Bacteroidales bacterium]|jgi:dephospho-CoA kinase|nr:dephospho-CoA kinase [Bacteroidales bacterium]
MSTKPLSIGLTGGIGSGKTLIAKVFMEIGVPVFFSDIVAKECYRDKSFVEEVARVISPTIIVNGEFSKQELARIIFTDNTKREQLNKLVHPKVLRMYNHWYKKQDTPYIILESAILFEIGWQQHFNKIINVQSPQEVAIERIMQRDGITEKEAMTRIESQLSSKSKSMLADYVIRHDNLTMLLPQILTVHNEILKLANK